MKKIVCVIFCMLLFTTTISIVPGLDTNEMKNTFSENGLKIKQIDYLFKEAKIPLLKRA